MASSPGTRATTPGARAQRLEPALHLCLVLVLPLMVSVAACRGVINPPVPTATAVLTVAPPPAALPPTTTPVPEQWVKNHRVTEMWSGPASDRSAISFGETSGTFCSFRVERTVDDARIFVYNPYSDGRFWIDAEAVGPVQSPERRRGPKSPDQNCAELVHEP